MLFSVWNKYGCHAVSPTPCCHAECTGEHLVLHTRPWTRSRTETKYWRRNSWGWTDSNREDSSRPQVILRKRQVWGCLSVCRCWCLCVTVLLFMMCSREHLRDATFLLRESTSDNCFMASNTETHTHTHLQNNTPSLNNMADFSVAPYRLMFWWHCLVCKVEASAAAILIQVSIRMNVSINVNTAVLECFQQYTQEVLWSKSTVVQILRKEFNMFTLTCGQLVTVVVHS